MVRLLLLLLLPGCTVEALCAASGVSCDGAPVTPDTETDADTDTDTDADADTDTDTDTDADPGFSLSAVEPAWATSLGDTQVVLRGDRIPSDPEVWFGGERATVLNASGGSLTVTAPAHDAGVVDIEVQAGGEDVVLSDAFTYIEDATGRTVLFGELGWYHYLGTYWESTPVDFGTVFLGFVEPSGFSSWEYYAESLGACVANHSYDGDLILRDLGVSSLVLNGTTDIRAEATSGGGFEAELRDGDFVAGARYDLQEVAAPGLPAFSIPSLIATPPSFSVSSPVLGGSFPANYSRGTPIVWSGSSSVDEDTVVVMLGLLNASVTAYEVLVTCAAPASNGRVEVPTGVWSSWSEGRQLDVLVGLMRNSGATSPIDHGDTQVAGIYWNLGAVITE